MNRPDRERRSPTELAYLPASRVAHHEAEGRWPCPTPSELLERRRRDTPDRVFLIDGAERLTFGQFAARVERLATGLAGLGIGPGDVVSWQLPSWWEAAAVAVALDWVGAINNPILPIYRAEEVSFIARQSGAKMLIVPGVFRGFDYREMALDVSRRLSGIEHVVVARNRPGPRMRVLDDLFSAAGSTVARAARGPNEVASLFYTSGTTSEPKGVMHTTSTLGAFARANSEVARGGPDDVSLLQFPVTHIGGLAAFVLLPILQGSRAVYLDIWDPERALSLIESEGVTGAGGPPAIIQGILAAPGFSPERVRTVRGAATGAADVPPELIREVRSRFGATSYRSYGLTECPMLTSGNADDPIDKCMYTDGRPTPGCRVRIVDAEGRALPPGAEGEIEAFGPQMCVGYLDASLNVAAFTPDGYLRTGDLGILDEQGYVRVTGRKKDIIIRKGENLSAKAIEDVLHDHPAVAEAAVIGVPDPASGERVCACLVLRPGAARLTLADISAFMEAKQVMRQKIPEQVEFLPALPRNATGKVLKHELRKRLAAT